MAEVRTADVTWHGDLLTGAGTIDYVSSGVFGRMPVSWAARTGPHNGKTSPEELLAAAHGSCFSMAFSARLAKNGTQATTLKVKVEITFDNASGGWKVTTSKITVVGDVPGIDLETFRTIAEDAKENCPISIALKGNVELVLDASLVAAA
jgi:osmotically inducible protein OsmC